MVGFETGVLTYACDWADQSGSHLVWLQESQKTPESHVYPCSHPFEFVNPSGISTEHYSVFKESSGTGCRIDWALWLPLERFEHLAPRHLVLRPVESERQWAEIIEMREEVEQEYSSYQPTTASRMVEHIRYRSEHLNGGWYLAEVNGAIVGGIGLLVFQTPVGKVGRLQDVDVRPSRRGEGLGNELLQAICEEAMRLGLDAICLKADYDDWPKDWYLRLGFSHVGTWEKT